MNQETGINLPPSHILTRRSPTIFGRVILFLGIFLLSSCSPALTPASKPTLLPPTNTLALPTSTQTIVPPTSAPTPTSTEKPTQTPTQTPTETPIPTIDVLALLNEVGIEYLKDTTSHFETEYGNHHVEFNFRIPKNQSDQIGKPYIQLPQDVLEEMYLHFMGRTVYFSKWLDPDRYQDFSNLTEELFRDGRLDGPREGGDWPEFRENARETLVDGPVPVNIGPKMSEATWNDPGVTEEISNLNINFVNKNRFDEVVNALDSAGVQHYTIIEDGDLDGGVAVILNGPTMEVISYDRSWSWGKDITSNAMARGNSGLPLERCFPGLEIQVYLNGILTMYADALKYTQQTMTYLDDAQSDSTRYYHENWYFTRFDPTGDLYSWAHHTGASGNQITEINKHIGPIFTP